MTDNKYDWYIVKVYNGTSGKQCDEKRFLSVNIDDLFTYLHDLQGKRFSIHGEKCLLDWG